MEAHFQRSNTFQHSMKNFKTEGQKLDSFSLNCMKKTIPGGWCRDLYLCKIYSFHRKFLLSLSMLVLLKDPDTGWRWGDKPDRGYSGCTWWIFNSWSMTSTRTASFFRSATHTTVTPCSKKFSTKPFPMNSPLRLHRSSHPWDGLLLHPRMPTMSQGLHSHLSFTRSEIAYSKAATSDNIKSRWYFRFRTGTSRRCQKHNVI